MRFTKDLFAALTATALLGALPVSAQETAAASDASLPAMSSTIMDPEGNQLGSVELAFTESGLGVINILFTDVEPGIRGVHLHQTGLCEAPFDSAGGHLADGKDHGVMTATGPHPGDMPNVTVPENGIISLSYFLPNLTPELIQDEDGTAFMIHSGADDYNSQPSGDAGNRIGCAVIAPPAG
ncbi:superoxide dismutase family protein [Paracoccus aerodenitrificans]|uniref:superoxide dismutase family protein n=1 Tax=Paracoccus aerodenitrificans TaxID=3017781 RepID=UPI0022F09B0F|nr:superoxide dismutase family protein [Paracoccus aerodenitrificans]WBU64981.1 superoxide dismutase family protein [Paracoccus aerodenitrificans]